MPDDDGEFRGIHIGAGCLSDPAMRSAMSPERWEAEQAALERERVALEEEAAARAADVSEQAFMARLHGVETHTVAEKLAEVAREADREDRRELSRLHVVGCGCSECGSKAVGSGIDPGASSRLPWQVQKSVDRVAANVEASKAASASKHDLGKLKSAVNELKAKLEKMTGRSAPTNAELIQARLMQLTAEVDDEVRVGHSGEPGVYW